MTEYIYGVCACVGNDLIHIYIDLHVLTGTQSGRYNSISGFDETKISIHTPMPKVNLEQKSSSSSPIGHVHLHALIFLSPRN